MTIARKRLAALAAAATTLAASASPAMATYSWWWNWGGHTPDAGPSNDPVAVPEIDAGSGLLAMAAVAAALLLAWELRRRRAG